jgi:hypothetical protein
MEYQEKILLLVVVLLVALAVYLTLVAPVAKPVANVSPNVSTAAAEDLLLKGLSFGMGQANYVYAYNEVSDGYRTSYVLTKNGNDSLLEVQNPLSTKQVYFLSNDTILCMSYRGNQTCASVQNEQSLANYLKSLRVKFLSDDLIQMNKDDISYLAYHGYAILDPSLRNGSIGGHRCTVVSYLLDFGNMSVDEAATFGVSSTTPKTFNWSVCVDNATGYLRGKSFNYTYGGMLHSYEYDLVSYAPASSPITPPQDLSGDVMTPLLGEMNLQLQMANCYTTKQGDALDECIATFALNNNNKALCEFAGGRRDRCLVAFVPVTRDVSICPAIESQPYKDDCYIELAGAYKNSSWCNDLQNASETGFCMNVSMPVAPTLPPAQNGTGGQNGSTHGNQTNSSLIAKEFLNFIDTKTGGKTNATNSSGSG